PPGDRGALRGEGREALRPAARPGAAAALPRAEGEVTAGPRHVPAPGPTLSRPRGCGCFREGTAGAARRRRANGRGGWDMKATERAGQYMAGGAGRALVARGAPWSRVPLPRPQVARLLEELAREDPRYQDVGADDPGIIEGPAGEGLRWLLAEPQ